MNSKLRAGSALARARQAAARLKPVAGTTGAAAKHGVRLARAWAASRVERTGHLVQDRIGPKVSSALSSAAQRIEPGQPRRPRWRKVAGSAVVAAASAVAGAVVNRRPHDGVAPGTAAGSSYHDAKGETAAEADEES